jgi:hypothetical protein
VEIIRLTESLDVRAVLDGIAAIGAIGARDSLPRQGAAMPRLTDA